MGEVVDLKPRKPAIERERERFEAWARTGFMPDDPDFLARTGAGEYSFTAARAAWAAWLARGICDELDRMGNI